MISIQIGEVKELLEKINKKYEDSHVYMSVSGQIDEELESSSDENTTTLITESVASAHTPEKENENKLQLISAVDNVLIGEQLNITSVEIPKQMENNVSTGSPKFDTLLSGDGVTPSACCLVTGIPGSGKSTCMMQLADSITNAGHIAIYNTCEESILQVSRMVKRLKLKHGFFVSSHSSIFDLIEHVTLIQNQNPDKTVFLFVDSLQTIEIPNVEYLQNGTVVKDKDGKPKKRVGRINVGSGVQVEVAKLLTNWCKRTYGVCFLIGQVNKDGTFSGRQAIKHWVDCHMHFDICKERYSSNYNTRAIEMTKNRFGIAGIYYPFEITSRGIKFIETVKYPNK